MGQQCEKVCGQPILTPVSEASQSYLKLIQSLQVEEQFPIEAIPETVKQKIRLLNLKVEYNQSELWKYQQAKTETNQRPYVIYIVINHDDIAKPVQLVPESEQVIVVTSQPRLSQSQGGQKPFKANIFNPQRFTQAAILLFRSNGQAYNEANPYVDGSKQKLEFEQFYYGPVNEKMSQPNGTKIFKTGEYYQGNIKDNSMQGEGIMTNALGNHSYNGTWSKNKPQGHGIEELDQKFKFEGQFVRGKWNGLGILTILNLANPLHLQGNFVNGTLQGHGTIKNRLDEIVFEGQFKNGKQNGKGKWYGPNGDKYQGDFVQGRKQGQGTFTFASGSVYRGSFKNGHPQGQGVLTKDGNSSKGHWFNGQNILIAKEDFEVEI